MKVIVFSGKARNGKTSAANIFKKLAEDDGKSAVVLRYAGYVKYVATEYYGWNGEKDENGRDLLQFIGDGVRNKYGEGFWVDKLMSDISDFCKDLNYVLIDDCRYPNEITTPKSMFETYSVRINRENFESELTDEQKKHNSEVALDGYNFDYVISTNSGVSNLCSPIRHLYKNIEGGE